MRLKLAYCEKVHVSSPTFERSLRKNSRGPRKTEEAMRSLRLWSDLIATGETSACPRSGILSLTYMFAAACRGLSNLSCEAIERLLKEAFR
jgi:hypothetical protein